jgi:ABC-2 type transport system permease protein
VIRPVRALAGRALRNASRRPQFFVPMLVFPSLLLAANTGGFSRTTQLPGFPKVHGFLDYQLAAAITQSLLLGGVSVGIAVALEIESGFFDRLIASPIPRTSIVFGRLAATFCIALLQVAFFLALGLVFGAEVQGGVGGALLVLLIGAIAGTGFGGIGMSLALRARNASLVQGIFPFAFVILFLSSAFFPMDLLQAPADWVAAYNPLSYIADGLRNPIIAPVDAGAVLDGLVAALGVTAAMTALSVFFLRGRLREP